MNKRATLKDIAKATGVHVSTVSRALSPNNKTPLTEEVAERIRVTAKELGYRPNRVAYSLRTQRTMTIGVVIPDITNPIFPPIARGIESVMEPAGYASILVNTDSNADREQRLMDVLMDRGVDGVIHTAVLSDEPSVTALANSGLPIVTLNRKIENTDIPYVVNDEDNGIKLVFEVLVRHGHTRIAHLAGPQNLSTGRRRLEAFRSAAACFGFDPDDLPVSIAERFDEAEGHRCARDILDRHPDGTAILCANDRLALGALGLLQDRGLSCPNDISLTGFNDMPFLEVIPPGLTTVRIQQYEAGATAARHLLSLLRGENQEVALETLLPVQVIERSSVAQLLP